MWGSPLRVIFICCVYCLVPNSRHSKNRLTNEATNNESKNTVFLRGRVKIYSKIYLKNPLKIYSKIYFKNLLKIYSKVYLKNLFKTYSNSIQIPFPFDFHSNKLRFYSNSIQMPFKPHPNPLNSIGIPYKSTGFEWYAIQIN